MVRKLFKQLIIEHDEMVEYQSVKQNEYELAVFNTDTKKLKLYKAEKKEFIEV
jgi:hypothetical protein